MGVRCGEPGTARDARRSARTKWWRLAGAMLALAPGLAVAACDEEGSVSVRPSRTTVSRDYELSGFTSVEIGSAFAAEIRRADGYSVSVTVDDNLQSGLRVDVSGSVLRIGLVATNINGPATLRAAIALPALREVRLSGSASAELVGFGDLDRLAVRLSGSSKLTGEVDAGEVDAELSGASVLAVRGGAERARLEASGSSVLDLFDFEVATATVDVSGASRAQISVSDVLERAEASGASTITYRGSPEVREVRATGSSKISKE